MIGALVIPNPDEQVWRLLEDSLVTSLESRRSQKVAEKLSVQIVSSAASSDPALPAWLL